MSRRLYYITEKRFFANRKEAKEYLGENNFRRLLKQRYIVYIVE